MIYLWQLLRAELLCTVSVQSRSVPRYFRAAWCQVGTELHYFPECTLDGAICLN